MIRLNFAEDDFEKLKTLVIESPKEAIVSIKEQIAKSLNKQFYSKAYFLLSLSYKSLNNPKEELKSLHNAVETAINLEDRIRSLLRRGSYYNDYCFRIEAYANYSAAENLYVVNNLDNIDLLLSIQISMLYLFRNYPEIFPYDALFNKIKSKVFQCQNKYILAHFYKAIGLYFFRIKDYAQTIEQFNCAANYFKEINNERERMQLNSLFSICKYKLKNPEYLSHKEVYEKHIYSVENKMVHAHYMSAIIRAEINPLEFCSFSLDWYHELFDYLLIHNAHATASTLYSFLAHKYETENNFELAIHYFKKQSEFNLKALHEEEENKIIDLHFQREIQHHLNSELTISSQRNSAPKIIKNYVHDNLTPYVSGEINKGKYQIMSNLLIEQFKTQVSICTNYGIKFLETNNIQVLESDGNYTILYDKDAKRHISSKPLAYYEKQLDPKIFLRTHRSYIINKNYIVHFFPGRVGKIELSNGLIIEVSARKMAEVRKKILN